MDSTILKECNSLFTLSVKKRYSIYCWTCTRRTLHKFYVLQGFRSWSLKHFKQYIRILFQQDGCTEVVNILLYLPSGQMFHQINKFPPKLTPLNLHQTSDKNHARNCNNSVCITYLAHC